MEKNLYIDASHPNETRVVLKSEHNIEDYEYEGLKNSLTKNNIYLFYWIDWIIEFEVLSVKNKKQLKN